MFWLKLDRAVEIGFCRIEIISALADKPARQYRGDGTAVELQRSLRIGEREIELAGVEINPRTADQRLDPIGRRPCSVSQDGAAGRLHLWRYGAVAVRPVVGARRRERLTQQDCRQCRYQDGAGSA
jgi:hypothetical protein